MVDALNERAMHEAVKRHLGEPSWRETLRLTAGVLAARGPAASMLLEDVEQFELDASALAPIRAERDALLGALANPATPEVQRLGIGEALGWAGDPRLTEEKRWIDVPEGRVGEGRSRGREREEALSLGDGWELGRANVWESRIHRPTPVGCFPGGHGPYGAWDLIDDRQNANVVIAHPGRARYRETA